MNEALPDVPEVRVVGLPQLTSGFDLVEDSICPCTSRCTGRSNPWAESSSRKLSENINLKGRGGAGFPFHKKLRSVAETRRSSAAYGPVVVVNGSEDEPACRKDTVLINRAPHLILDGALLVAPRRWAPARS